MDVVEVVFQYQLGVKAALLVAIFLEAKGAIEIIEAAGGQEGEVGVVVTVEEEGMLHIQVECCDVVERTG